MTNKEVYALFEKMEQKFDSYCERQEVLNNTVIRNEERIKGIWKIPTISGVVVSFISVITIIIARL